MSSRLEAAAEWGMGKELVVADEPVCDDESHLQVRSAVFGLRY